MLKFLDIFYTIVHLVIIGFNLTGWIFPRTRKLHLWCVATTCFCWIIPGIWYGFGYCPITDWQWNVKQKLGERNLPASFITYILNNFLDLNIPEPLVISLTGILFLLVILVTVHVNFLRKFWLRR
jgi:hypothetical protein